MIEPDAELELSDVCLHPDIKEILADEQWIDDATGLVPHTLAVLRACHKLMEKLAALAMGPLTNHKTGSQIMNVIIFLYFFNCLICDTNDDELLLYNFNRSSKSLIIFCV